MPKTIIKLDPALGRRLKVEAALRGVSMTALASAWIDANLSIKPPSGHKGHAEAMIEAFDKVPRRVKGPKAQKPK